jgi:hypothetical protein
LFAGLAWGKKSKAHQEISIWASQNGRRRACALLPLAVLRNPVFAQGAQQSPFLFLNGEMS